MTTNEWWTLGIAAYGALVATGVLVWDVIKWKSAGPKLTMTSVPEMRVFNYPPYEGKTLVSTTVRNLGDGATTITGLGFYQYKSYWHRLFRCRPVRVAVVSTPSVAQPLPFRIEPGAEWIGLMHQSDEVTSMICDACFCMVVSHSHSKRGLRQQVRLLKS